MRVLVLVSNDVVHDARVLKEAQALVRAGHEVTFIGWDRGAKASRMEITDGITIHRIRTEGFMRALGKDLFRIPLWWQKVERLALSMAVDVVHCHDLDSLPIGVRMKKRRGVTLVYDCHEVFYRMIAEDVPKFISDYAGRLERRLVPHADRIVVVSEVVQSYIREISGRDSIVVNNYPDFAVERYEPPPNPPFTVLYLGTLHPSRFVIPAIEVVAEMTDVRLVIAGSKKLAPIVEAMCATHPNTTFLGTVPNKEIAPLIRSSHAVLSMFDPGLWINQMGMPNKIFEAMAAGRPSIVADGMLMADIVRKEECGVVVPYTEEGFREAVVRLRDDPALAERLGRNGLAAAERAYNWTSESKKLLDVYASLTPAG
jgi:glycosyltransferase involved in cell wall biosynthesis